MGVASGCGEQEVGVASGSGWNLCVWQLGVVVRGYIYRFPHTAYPYSCSLQQHSYFLFIFLLMFFFLVPVLFCNYILCIKYFFAKYKRTYGQLRASHGSHIKVAHSFIHEEAHTNARFISCAGL